MTKLRSSNHSRGAVVRVKMINFLTYDEVETWPASGLNLLLGPNGTGKSTIVCALCLGLAGMPQVLGRSTHLADYIKHGKDVATLEVELCSGSEAKNPVIKTVFRRMGSNEYFVDNQKKKREEIREFVRGYNIQVDNLCQFLAQDRVVEFARQSKQDLLLNTEKAAGTVDLYEQHMKLQNSFSEGRELRTQLATISEKKKLLEQKLAALEKPFKQYAEYEKRREKLDLLEKKRPWLEHEQSREEAAAVKAKLDRVKQEYDQHESHLKPLQDEIANLKTQARHAERLFENQKRRSDQAKTRLLGDVESLNRIVDEADTITRSLQTAQDDYEAKQRQIRGMEAAVAELCRNLEKLNDEDVRPQLQLKDRELQEVNRRHDELDPQRHELESSLRAEQAKRASLTNQLNSMQDRQRQQLEQLRRIDNQAYNAYTWYLSNKDRFQGAVWLPALDVRVPDQRNIKFVESCIGRRDLFSFVFENFNDLQSFLSESKRQNIRVGAGVVPEDAVIADVGISSDLRRLGFRDFVCNMFEAPDGLKKYLTKLSGLNNIPVGTEETEQNLERVTEAVKGRFGIFLTPNKRLVMSESRYGGGSTILNQVLGDPFVLPYTTGVSDDSQENSMKNEIMASENEINRIQASLKQIDDEIRETKRRRETLQQEKNLLRQRAGERSSLQTQINFKRDRLKESKSSLPDLESVERECNQQLKERLEEKLATMQRIVDYMKEIEVQYSEMSETSINRAEFSATALSHQRELDSASSSLREDKERLDKLQSDYNEKKENVKALLEQACRAVGTNPLSKQPIPNALLEAFKSFPDELEELDEQMEEQRALLQQTLGIDRSVAIEYQTRLDDLNRTKQQETQIGQAVSEWETNVGANREKWLSELQHLIETISRNFSRFMSVLDCAGEVELEKPDDINDFTKYGVKVKVKFRDNQPLRELDPQHQSGGERSVSTMLYMLALQELSHVPFRCVDEINQGMDPVNERKVFEMMTKLLSGTEGVLNCTQYFMLTPKLLHGLPMGENIEVWLIHNGPHMLRNDKWSVSKFLKRKHALNEVEAAAASQLSRT